MLSSIVLRRAAPSGVAVIRRFGAPRAGAIARAPRIQLPASTAAIRTYAQTPGEKVDAIKNELPSADAVKEEAKAKASGSGGKFWAFIGAAALGAGGWYYLMGQEDSSISSKTPTQATYVAAARDIAEIMDDIDYDDGSWGPTFLRLAWHSSGTYNKHDGTGGSDGATIRLKPEIEYGANAGLYLALKKLESVKAKYPNITYADLFTMAGVVAIKEMGGPTINWRPGRRDKADQDKPCTEDGRLPDASQGAKHLRDIFYRQGFNDQEIVALSGAHALGRCHTDRSGYEGPWTFSPTTFTNDYFKLLLSEKWVKKKWNGPEQYIDKATGDLMMLPTDMEVIWDKSFRKWAEAYAKDEELFRDHFAKAFGKMIELGFKGPQNVGFMQLFPPEN